MLVTVWLGVADVSPIANKTCADDQFAAAKEPSPAVKTVIGPWGHLEYFETVMVAPHQLMEEFRTIRENPVWRFPGWDAKRLFKMLEAISFDSGQLDWMNEQGRLRFLDSEIRLYPPDEMITGMTPPQRIAIHRALCPWIENEYHFAAYCVESGDAEQHFKSLGFSDETAEFIASLSFQEADGTWFSEIEFVYRTLQDPGKKYLLLRTLTRMRSLIVRLKLTKETDIESIASYWCGHNVGGSVTALLESVLMTRQVDYVDIAHLLPPTPRKLLNTYPDLSRSRAGKRPDCFWTAMNFFRTESSDRVIDFDAAIREVNELYGPATGERQFGDLVLLVPNESRKPIHAAIYIAADIVFTKNGSTLYAPWVMMSEDDMMKPYKHSGAVHRETFRLKSPYSR